jgi:hypothetical protein
VILSDVKIEETIFVVRIKKEDELHVLIRKYASNSLKRKWSDII